VGVHLRGGYDTTVTKGERERRREGGEGGREERREGLTSRCSAWLASSAGPEKELGK